MLSIDAEQHRSNDSGSEADISKVKRVLFVDTPPPQDGDSIKIPVSAPPAIGIMWQPTPSTLTGATSPSVEAAISEFSIASRSTHAIASPLGQQPSLNRGMTTTKKEEYTIEGWDVCPDKNAGTPIKLRWDHTLPEPPSNPQIGLEDDVSPTAPTICVFNVNTPAGSTMVRYFSKQGMNVVGVVRVATSPKAKQLMKLNFVKIIIAEYNNERSLLQAVKGCQKVFLVSKYWSKFESKIEEEMAANVLSACTKADIQKLVLVSFEDIMELQRKNVKSEITTDSMGRIVQSFSGMERFHTKAKELDVDVTNVLTSYFDDGDDNDDCPNRKSLVLIRTSKGKILAETHVPLERDLI